MINDLNDLIGFYYMSLNEGCIEEVLKKIKSLTEKRPRYVREILKDELVLNQLKYLNEMKIKKVRNQILKSTNKEEISKFNDKIKLEEGRKFMLNFHSPEYWIAHLLDLIKNRSRGIYTVVNNTIGYDSDRLDDYRIYRHEVFTTSFYYEEDLSFSDKEWSDKLKCTCIRDVFNKDELIFKCGLKYDFRKSKISDARVVNLEYSQYVFESGSFGDYFIDRMGIIDSILGE